jgi:hypothetical protein
MSRSLLRQTEAHIGPDSHQTPVDSKETHGFTRAVEAQPIWQPRFPLPGNHKRTSEIPAEACGISLGRLLLWPAMSLASCSANRLDLFTLLDHPSAVEIARAGSRGLWRRHKVLQSTLVPKSTLPPDEFRGRSGTAISNPGGLRLRPNHLRMRNHS